MINDWKPYENIKKKIKIIDCQLVVHSRVVELKIWLQGREGSRKFYNPAIFLQHVGNKLLSKYGNFRKKNPQNMATLAHFFSQKKKVCISWNGFTTKPKKKGKKQKKTKNKTHSFNGDKFEEEQIV
jgi:hypothetical protein